MPGLLVSVRSLTEAQAAFAGGAALIDVKEPTRGSLGRADPETVTEIMTWVAGRRPVSAALGELLETPSPLPVLGLAYAKWGMAGCAERPDWQSHLTKAGEHLQAAAPGCRLVAVAYADHGRAQAPPPECVWAFARDHGATLLLDTFAKDGTTLLDWMTPGRIHEICAACRGEGVRVALAGSLGEKEIRTLLGARPDWFAVRGAACSEGDRGRAVDPLRVRRLADLLPRCGN
jgi:uncharacterized protein (UPF0264 family)